MTPTRFAALAVAHRSANAVGPIAFVFGDESLHLELRGVRPHSRGFAAVGASERATLEVPYAALRGLVRDGRTLVVSFDARLVVPYNRFAVGRVRRGGDVDAVWIARVLGGLASFGWVAAIALAVTAALSAMRWGVEPVTSGVIGLAAGAFASGVVRGLREWLLWGGPGSDRLRDELEARFRERLGLGDGERPGTDAAPAPEILEQALATVSRPRWLLPVAALGMVGVVGTVAMLRRYGVADIVRLPVDEARVGLKAPVDALLGAARAAVTPKHPACRCERADSPLWPSADARLAVIVSPIRGELATTWLEPGVDHPIERTVRERAEFEVAVVNNSNRPIPSVELGFQFKRRTRKGGTAIVERGLSYPHVLRPGRSVRWRVRARGTTVRLTNHVSGTIERDGYAPAESFARLLRHSIGAVRLHGALMLAVVDPARAAEALPTLADLTPPEERGLQALRAAVAPLVACDVREGHACIMNRGTELTRVVTIQDGWDRALRIEDLFFAGVGVRVPLGGLEAPLRVTTAP